MGSDDFKSYTIGPTGNIFAIEYDQIITIPANFDLAKAVVIYDGENGTVAEPENLAVDHAGNLYFSDAPRQHGQTATA